MATAPVPTAENNRPLWLRIIEDGQEVSIFNLIPGRQYYYVRVGALPVQFIRGDESITEHEIRQYGIQVGTQIVLPEEGQFYRYGEPASGGYRRRRRSKKTGKARRKGRKATMKRRM
jgi:hypothetical protein